VEIRVKEDDLAFVGQLEIGIAGPADRKRARTFRYCATGRGEHRRMAGRIARLGRKRGVRIDGFDPFRARIVEWPRLYGWRSRDAGKRSCNNQPSIDVAHDRSPD